MQPKDYLLNAPLGIRYIKVFTEARPRRLQETFRQAG